MRAAHPPAAAHRAVVTGAARGIGRAVVERLIADGFAVSMWDNDDEELARVAARLERAGAGIHTATVDVRNASEIEDAVAGARTAIGSPDVLVNNAGVLGARGPALDMPIDNWHRVLDVNLTGALLCSRAVVPAMRDAGWGRVVNIASIAGREGRADNAPYAASKAGLISLTKSLGLELAHDGVLVNCVTPGPADTAIVPATDPEHHGRLLDQLVAMMPMGRLLRAEEVAELVAWLSSPSCSFSTGAVFDISGGRSAG